MGFVRNVQLGCIWIIINVREIIFLDVLLNMGRIVKHVVMVTNSLIINVLELLSGVNSMRILEPVLNVLQTALDHKQLNSHLYSKTVNALNIKPKLNK